MGLEVQSQIFKWLQSINIVKDGKRIQNAIQLSQQVTSKLFDGLYISRILKILLKQKKQDQAIIRLQSIKQNSTPAIRLYNWNIICQALKKIDYTIDYSQKSKLLNIQPEPLIRLLNYLYALRSNVDKVDGTKSLQVETSNISKRTLKEAFNIFQFLVISISKHFKLSVQHTLNLFLDNNKYLSHLLVKGVKNQFQPVYLLLSDILQNINFIVDTLFCVEENQSVFFFFNAIKPCLISKEKQIARQCLVIIKEIYENYTKKNVEITSAVNWMQKQGINTVFFSITRHPELFQEALAIAYAFLDQKLFNFLAPQQKSLLWANQTEKIHFFNQFIITSHPSLMTKFLQSTVFDQWNRYCLKMLKKSKNNAQICMLITAYEHIWMKNGQFFEKNESGMPTLYISFLKNCTLAQSQMVFIEGSRILFHLLYKLGNSKNSYAPMIYKTILSSLGNQTESSRIQFILLNFIEAFKQITTLPATPLAQPLIKHMQSFPSATQIQLCRLVLADPKLRQQTAQDILETLAKVFFQNIQFGILAIDTKIQHLKKKQDEQILNNYCKATLGHFVSVSRQINRSILQLKSDFNRYKNQETMKRGQANFLKNTTKYLILSNLVSFVQKCLFLSEIFKADAQSMIFHTYIKVKKETKKESIHKMLLPLLYNYTDQQQLQSKINQFEMQSLQQPKISAHPILSSSIQRDQISQIFETPLPSPKQYKPEKQSSLKTQQNSPSLSMKKSHLQSIKKQFSLIKQKRELQRQHSQEMMKEKDLIEKKKQLYRSVINQKRIVQFGRKFITDVDYKNVLQFDSVKVQGNLVGLPNIKLLNLDDQEQSQYIDDLDSFMKKYRKVWRFLFYQHSSVDTVKSKKQTGQEKINIAQIWKMIKDYQFEQLKKEQSLMIVKKINESMKRKNDLQNLTYLGFQEFILQMCHYAYGKAGYSHLPPSQQILKFVDLVRSVTASKGRSTEIFDSPEQVYFQETQVIRQFNRRLKQSQQYVLPEGYKKIKRDQLIYTYTIKPDFKKIKNSYKQVFEILQQILFTSFKINIIQPRTQRTQKFIARPVLFQNIKQKLKEYTGGYLKPKASVNLASITKNIAPVKIEFHPLINFSLGIKLGLAGVNIKYRTIAEQVAYWIDDALDAVEAGKLKVANKSKIRIQNQIIRRKRSAAYQMKLEKLEYDKRQRIRAQTVKHQTQKYVEKRQQDEAKRRQKQRQNRLERKSREQKEIKRKLQQFEQAKSKLQSKRKQIQQQKQLELQSKKKEKVEYRKNVEQYFKKKKQQLQQTQKKMKANRELEQNQKLQKKNRQIQKKKRLQIEIFKKEEQVLEKIVGSKMNYQEVYKSPQIQAQLLLHRPRMKLMFDLLLKYEKSKISSTKQNQLGINTLNFFCIKTNIIPFLLPKNALTFIYKNTIKELNGARNGFSFNEFQEFIFKIIAKGKQKINNKASEYDEEQEVQLQNSPSNQRKKKILTDEYAIDAAGVTPITIKRLMQFLRLPFDKQQAQQRFRQMLQYKNKLPTTIALKQAKSILDSTVS